MQLADVQQVVMTLAAAVGAYAALSGVNAWRKQLTGKTEYEVGVAVLRALYKIREAVKHVRRPYMRLGEVVAAVGAATGTPLDVTDIDDFDEFMETGRSVAYESRWRGVSEALQDLDVARLEAEVIWGGEASSLLSELRSLVNELRLSLNDYLEDREDPEIMEYTSEQRAQLKAIVIGRGDAGDEFNNRVEALVARIEQFVRPLLGHKRRRLEKRSKATRQG